MKFFSFFLILMIVTACNSTDKNSEAIIADSVLNNAVIDSTKNYIYSFTDTALENKISAALLRLPFVKKSNDYIDSFSNHKTGISFLMENPGENESEISVQAGYSSNERFETYYRFFVDPKTITIKVYDPVADKKLTIREYLNNQK